MAERGAGLVPLAVLGVAEERPDEPDLPIAYIPRIPVGADFREVLDRSVGWGRR